MKKKVTNEVFFCKNKEVVLDRPHETIWEGIVMMLCWVRDKVIRTKVYQTKSGGKIPRHYRSGMLKQCYDAEGKHIGEGIVNYHAFTDRAIFGRARSREKGRRDGEYVALRCTIERKVMDQRIFDPVMRAVRLFLGQVDADRDQDLDFDLIGHVSVLHYALRVMEAIFRRYPDIVMDDGRRLQDDFEEFINPEFLENGLPFCAGRQLAQLASDPEHTERFLERLGTTFEQVYNPISFEKCTPEELTEAVKARKVYELKLTGEQGKFEALAGMAEFALIQEKLFGLLFRSLASSQILASKDQRAFCWESRHGWTVEVHAQLIMVAAVNVGDKGYMLLEKQLGLESSDVTPATDSDDDGSRERESLG